MPYSWCRQFAVVPHHRALLFLCRFRIDIPFGQLPPSNRHQQHHRVFQDILNVIRNSQFVRHNQDHKFQQQLLIIPEVLVELPRFLHSHQISFQFSECGRNSFAISWLCRLRSSLPTNLLEYRPYCYRHEDRNDVPNH